MRGGKLCTCGINCNSHYNDYIYTLMTYVNLNKLKYPILPYANLIDTCHYNFESKWHMFSLIYVTCIPLNQYMI